MAINYTDINGIRYDFSSIEFSIGPVAVPVLGIQSIDYSYGLKPGAVNGTSPQKLGRTRGKYESDASISVYKAEEDLILSAVDGIAANAGLGFMEQSFDILCIYSDYLQTPVTDTIVGCRIAKVTQNHKQGPEGLMSKIDLDTMYVLPGGRVPYLNFLP